MKQHVWILAVLAALFMTAGCTTLPGSSFMGTTADQQLARDVQMRLANDPVTSEFTFGVTAAAGVVTLEGVVPTETLRVRIIGIARGTEGVMDVVDKLQRR